MPEYKCATCILGARRSERDNGSSRTGGINIWMAMSQHVGARHRTQILCKSNNYFKPLSHFSNPSQIYSSIVTYLIENIEYLKINLSRDSLTVLFPQDRTDVSATITQDNLIKPFLITS